MKLKNALIQYCKKISNKKIVACQKHIWACERFLLDLEREGTEEFPFIFDEAKAQRFIDWSRLFKHTKGKLAGKKIEFDILQKFKGANIYGWYHKDTGYRRFKKVYDQLARKNAKSQFWSVVASYELMVFLNGELSEVYCAATTKDQAKIVYDETRMMLERCPDLKGKWREAYRKIDHIKSNSILKPLSKEDKKSGDGLNPQCGIIDEYHAHLTSEILDVVDSGMGARQEPLLGIVTTAGFDLNNPCYRVEYKIASNILDPDNVFVLEWEFVMICELEVNQTSDPIEKDGRVVAVGDLLDDINDESTWVKANPIICSYPEGVDSLRDKLAEAKVSPDKMRNFLTKHMNVWINQRKAGYLDLQKWNACGNDEFDYNKLRGQPCYIGVDLSAKIDLTSVSLVFPPINGGKYKIVSHSFIPETRLTERIRKDHMPFDSWVSDGWITCTDGEVIDYNEVKKYIVDILEDYGFFCESFCNDPWAAIQLSSDLIVQGYEVIDIRQGIKTLSEPTKVFREEVYKGNVEHDNNPVLSWALGNAIVKTDQNENIMLDKQKSIDRIDPAAATMNAMVRAITHDANSGYNNRGMRGFDV